MSITTFWQRKSTKSRRSWRRSGDRGSPNSLAWWAPAGPSKSTPCLSPTPWARARPSDPPVRMRTHPAEKLSALLCFLKNYSIPYIEFTEFLFVSHWSLSCLLSDGPVSMPNMPNQNIMNRMQMSQGTAARLHDQCGSQGGGRVGTSVTTMSGLSE